MASNGASNGSADLVVPILINGKESTTSTTFDVVSPASHKLLWKAASASIEDANRAVEAAGAAFKAWSKTKPAYRRDLFYKAAEILKSRTKEIADYMNQEIGAVPQFSEGFCLPTTIEMLKDVAGRISGITGGIPTPAQDGTGAFLFKEPYGVVLGISPWNGGTILAMRAALFALAVGNTVVLKGSELSPRMCWAIGDVLTQAGLPAGVLNVLFVQPRDAAPVTTALIEHPLVKKVNFTGSTAVGSIVAATAGKALKPVLMELGGKASAIVLDDADIEKAAFQCALGAFMASGQICMATERILVQQSILDQFVPALKEAVSKVFANEHPSPILVQGAAVEKNKKLVSSAVSQGAKVLHGDHNVDEKHPETNEVSKTRMRPVILGDVTKDMDLFYTESFGPSVSVIAVSTEDEAIEIANDTDYGLSGSVFTKGLGRGLRVARQIESGAVHINAMTVHDESVLPHGGVKKSGWGRFNADSGLEEFVKLKTITYQE